MNVVKEENWKAKSLGFTILILTIGKYNNSRKRVYISTNHPAMLENGPHNVIFSICMPHASTDIFSFYVLPVSICLCLGLLSQ